MKIDRYDLIKYKYSECILVIRNKDEPDKKYYRMYELTDIQYDYYFKEIEGFCDNVLEKTVSSFGNICEMLINLPDYNQEFELYVFTDIIEKCKFIIKYIEDNRDESK